MDKVNSSLKLYRNITISLSIVALALSYYTVYVAEQKTKDPSYKAICDFSPRLTCSAVFASEFGKGFGVVEKILGKDSPVSQFNGVYGYGLYAVLIFCSLFTNKFITKIQALAVGVGGIASTYGFINGLYLSPYLCVICMVVHSTNYILVLITYLKIRKINQTVNIGKKKKK